MIYVGVDPGMKGAFAFLDEAGAILDLVPMPLHQDGKHYDLVAVGDLFRARATRTPDRGLFVTVERLEAMPTKFRRKGGRADDEDANVSGVIVNHRRGMTWAIIGILAAMRIPYSHVRPQSWQAKMLGGWPERMRPKEKSVATATRRWPATSFLRTPRSRKPDDGLTDAALLGEYGRVAGSGGAVFAAAARSTSSAPSVQR